MNVHQIFKNSLRTYAYCLLIAVNFALLVNNFLKPAAHQKPIPKAQQPLLLLSDAEETSSSSQLSREEVEYFHHKLYSSNVNVTWVHWPIYRRQLAAAWLWEAGGKFCTIFFTSHALLVAKR